MTTTRTATRSNTYAGICSDCGATVPAQAGVLGGKVNGRWTVHHTSCTKTAPVDSAWVVTSSTTARTHAKASHSCESCGSARAHYATDLSGIGGYACYRCDDGSLSFA